MEELGAKRMRRHARSVGEVWGGFIRYAAETMKGFRGIREVRGVTVGGLVARDDGN